MHYMQCSDCFSASIAVFPSLFLYQCLLWSLGRLQHAVLTALFPFPVLFLKFFFKFFLVVSMEILSNIWMHKHLMLVVYENLDCSCLLFPPYMLWLHTFFIDWKPTVYKSALCHCLWTLVEEFNQKSLENGFYSFSFSDLRGTYFFVWIWATAECPYLLPEGLSLVFSFRVCLLRMKSGFFSFWQHLNFLFVHQVFILSFCCSVFKFIDSFFSSHDPLLILSVSVFVLLNFRKFFVSFF